MSRLRHFLFGLACVSSLFPRLLPAEETIVEVRSREEMIQAVNVTGIFLRRPPMSFFMSKEWCEPLWLMEPAQRNRQHLKKAWVMMWNTAASQAPVPRPSIM